jgi:exopolysaccharide biosynthesis WecB/TagA/CpsF family protein
MGGKIVRIGPVDVSAMEQVDALELVVSVIRAHEPACIGFCNAHTVNLARRDKRLARALAQMVVLNDGIGLDIASKMLYGEKFPANLNGTDLTPAVLDHYPESLKIFLLGSRPEIADRAAENLIARYPRHRLAGVHHGFFSPADEASIAAKIAASAPDLVLVGMGQPRQEIWAVANAHRLGCTVMCVGAMIDRFAGVVPRAPLLLRKAGLEWVYRLVLEPRRLFSRYVTGNATFLRDVYKEKRSR